MSLKSDLLRKKEKMEVTLPILMDHYVTAKKVAGCSPKTLVNLRSNLQKFVHFLERQGHSLRLNELNIQHARTYIASLQGEARNTKAIHSTNRFRAVTIRL